MIDASYFARLADYLEDTLAERMLQNREIMNNIQKTMRHEDTKMNFHVLSILRLWCRKMTQRINLEKDKRVRLEPSIDLQELIKPSCLTLAEKASLFLKNTELMPIACQVCNDLLTVADVPPSSLIVQKCLDIMHIKGMKIPLLEIISKADFEISGLPLLDPLIATQYIDLHAKLTAISPEESRDDINSVKKVVNKILAINNGSEPIDRDIIEFCDVESIIPNAPPELFALHPADDVRIRFYNYALKNKLPILDFLDPVICCGLFDAKVSKQASELVASQFPSLASITLTHKQIANLQCLPMKENGAIFQQLDEILQKADDFTFICSSIRFLYHKEKWVQEKAQDVLKLVFQFEYYLNVEEQEHIDSFVETFLTKLRNPNNVDEKGKIGSLYEIIIDEEYGEDIRKISANRLCEYILDPYQDVSNILPALHNFPFESYPELMHAVAIRDGEWKINEVERIFELVKAINRSNAHHLLPVLSRIVFAPVINIEKDGANLLRLPIHFGEKFEVRGSSGYYKPGGYEPTETFPLAPIIQEWISFKPNKSLPIKEGFNIRALTAISNCNAQVASDILEQIDEDETSASKLLTSASPGIVTYLLLVAVLCAKKSSKAAAKICHTLVNDALPTSLKLNQALVEFGGDCEIPPKITDYVKNKPTQRAALAMLATHVQFKKEITDFDFSILDELVKEELPINSMRQVCVLLAYKKKCETASLLIEHRDSIVRSLAFQTAEPTHQNALLALACVSDDKQSISTRAAALTVLSDYHKSNPPLSNNLAALYNSNQGETLYTLQLLQFLKIPSVRQQVSQTIEFVEPFLNPKGTPLFVHSALQCLVGFNFEKASIAISLTKLLSVEEYSNDVLLILSKAGKITLLLFESDVINTICDTMNYSDLNLAMISINHLLLAGLILPNKAMESLIDLYSSFLDASCCSSALHTLFPQIFALSQESHEIALKNGFLELALKEMNAAIDSPDHQSMVLITCAQFVYDYPEGQEALIDTWSLEFLIKIFDVDNTVLHFFSCLSSRNRKVQSLFATQIGNVSIFTKILDAFDSKSSNSYLLQLCSSLLNAEYVRRIVYRKKKIKAFTSRLTYYVAKKDWALSESMLKILITLTYYSDGCDELYGQASVVDFLEILTENDEICEMPLFWILLKNLKAYQRTWNGLVGALTKANKDLYEKILNLADSEIQK